jgi:hypothetical protein
VGFLNGTFAIQRPMAKSGLLFGGQSAAQTRARSVAPYFYL